MLKGYSVLLMVGSLVTGSRADGLYCIEIVGIDIVGTINGAGTRLTPKQRAINIHW